MSEPAKPLRGPIRFRRPATLPTRALDGEAILKRAPNPRLYIGGGMEPTDQPPQPLTVGIDHVTGLAVELTAAQSHAVATGNPHQTAITDIQGLQAALDAAGPGRATLQLQPGQANPCPRVMGLLGITTAAPARVRLYHSLSQLQADAARPGPAEPADGACLAEAVTTAGALTVTPHPAPVVDTGGALWVLAEPATATTLTYLRLEA